jgi:hypothetical protein
MLDVVVRETVIFALADFAWGYAWHPMAAPRTKLPNEELP